MALNILEYVEQIQVSFPQRRRPIHLIDAIMALRLWLMTPLKKPQAHRPNASTLLLGVNSTNCSQIFASTCVFLTTC